jgi:hypothetical protein
MTDGGTTISQFIWKWQIHFRVRSQVLVEHALKQIGASFDPEVVLVGLTNKVGALFPICIEPETGPLKPESFDDVDSRAAEIHDEDPEKAIWHTDPDYHASRQAWLQRKARGQAIREVLDAGHAYGDKRWFVSWGQRVGDFWVHAAVGVSTTEFGEMTKLENEEVRRLYAPSSLARSVIDLLLEEIDGGMRAAEPSPSDIRRSANDIVYDAAERLLRGCMYRVGGIYLGNPLEEIDAIAMRAYEKEKASGRILLVRANDPRLEIVDSLQEPAHTSQSRAIRKLLQATDTSTALLVDEGSAYGFGRLQGDVPDEGMESFEIEIVDHATWELRSGRQILMRSSYRRVSLPGKDFDEPLLRDTLSRVFGDDVDSDLISDLVHEASKATHGATLVISERAEAEAERLSGSATLVVPEKLSQLRLRRSSRMDGATLVDPSGTCHAIGVILDGEAQRDGDPSRGARYNSSNRYVKSAAHAVLAVIVSEDGGVTIVPTPRKRIRRQRVLDALAVLEESMTREERGAFGSAFDELSEMMFYLSDAECARVNELAKMVQDAAMEVGGITIVRPTLIANPEMNESFFIP